MNQEVQRIISSNVCETISSTVHKNEQEIMELERMFVCRSQQITQIYRKISEEMAFFQKISAKNGNIKKGAYNIGQLNKELKSLLQNFGRDVLLYFEQYHCQSAEALKEAVRSTQQEYQHKVSEMTEKIRNLQQRAENAENRWKKELQQNKVLAAERESVYAKENKSIPIMYRSRRNTADTDILKTVSNQQDLTMCQNQMTQPNLEQTILADFSRKKSMVICPSATTIVQQFCFNFDKLMEVSYQGKLIGGKKTGKGIVKYEGRYVYEGQFIKGQREGQGVLKHCGSQVYSGQWHQDVFHGRGTLRSFPSENKYRKWKSFTGRFLEGIIQGIGSVEYSDGEVLISSFKNGIPSSSSLICSQQDGSLQYGHYEGSKFYRKF